MTALLASRAAFLVAVVLLGLGLFVLIDDPNLLKKILGLNVFQTGIFLVYVAAAVRAGGRSPLVVEGGGPYVNPLPHVLILTAIVVGVSVTALAAALVARIHAERATVRADELRDGAGEVRDRE
ncbi:cation:proton antiporter subunit C [Haloarculaceae archaeon H-GB2-1]|nr:cation:proton antiporter subunit C [Haloarculaceae archaeon H-GB1-1]MEA5386277.1 cation:proton antiporter subunit C [Haloarculaceae archaeon H-GB11]MEA5407780.1 cation:proton antiporter subunit C [Haloarculaceae archaeon H-GB2-1]